MGVLENMKYYAARLFCRKPVAVRNSKIHSMAKIGDGAQLVDCTVGRYTYMYGSSATSTEIGAFCSIARGCVIGGGAHPTNWVSTSPVFYNGKSVLKANFSNNKFSKYKKTVIGNDVWIGSNCLIKGGVSIGDGAIIGMGSVLTHDVPPYEIWAGNPARFIRKRFDDETIEKLSKTQWWNLSDVELKSIANCFDDPQKVIELFEEKKT